MKNILSLFLLLLIGFQAPGQSIWYVNQAVQGGLQTGDSWGNAMPDLQQALAAVAEGDQIWVAEGVYFTTSGFDRSIAFRLKHQVALFGGFSGTETSLEQRDWAFYETMLSGNINDPALSEDNAYHVVVSEGQDSTSVLDGFTITQGYAFGADADAYGGGMLILPSNTLQNSTPKIINCHFTDNRAFFGGGMSCYRNSINYVNPILRNCRFTYNRATLDGGGFYKNSPAIADAPFEVRDCYFGYNSSTNGSGAGVCLRSPELDNLFINSTFEHNSTTVGSGGGIFLDIGLEFFQGIVFKFEHCIINENEAAEGGGICFFGNPLNPQAHGIIAECEFSQNKCTNGFGAAYLIYGFNNAILDLEVTKSSFIRNLCNLNSISLVAADSDSKCSLKIDGCIYKYNYNLYDTTWSAFPVNYGVGGFRGQFDALIQNSLFVGNGGILNAAGSSGGCKMKTVVNNCTTIYNGRVENVKFNKSYFDDFNGIDEYNETWVTNCIIRESSPGGGPKVIFANNFSQGPLLKGYHVDFNILQMHPSSIPIYPEVFGPNNLAGVDVVPLYTNPLIGDYSLLPCSPGVNAGHNLVPDTLGTLTDMAGNPRIFDGQVDMGAYEAQDTCAISQVKQPNVAEINLSVHPNPASAGGLIKVRVNEPAFSRYKWIIRDQAGRVVARGIADQAEFAIASPLISGSYLLELKSGDKTGRRKLIVF